MWNIANLQETTNKSESESQLDKIRENICLQEDTIMRSQIYRKEQNRSGEHGLPIPYLEHILRRDRGEAGDGALQCIQRVTHVALSSENNGL